MPPKGRKCRVLAFTLVELLVTISIAALLIALMIPAYKTVLSRLKTMQCTSNLRIIGQAMNLYLTDHGGVWPAEKNNMGNNRAWDDGWWNALPPYIDGIKESGKSGDIWWCPSAKKIPAGSAFNRHYGYNKYALSGRWNLNSYRVPSPSLTVLIGEINANSAGFNPDTEPSFLPDEITSYRVSHPHHTANYLFCDGHVETLRYEGPDSPPLTIFKWW